MDHQQSTSYNFNYHQDFMASTHNIFFREQMERGLFYWPTHSGVLCCPGNNNNKIFQFFLCFFSPFKLKTIKMSWSQLVSTQGMFPFSKGSLAVVFLEYKGHICTGYDYFSKQSTLLFNACKNVSKNIYCMFLKLTRG